MIRHILICIFALSTLHGYGQSISDKIVLNSKYVVDFSHVFTETDSLIINSLDNESYYWQISAVCEDSTIDILPNSKGSFINIAINDLWNDVLENIKELRSANSDDILFKYIVSIYSNQDMTNLIDSKDLYVALLPSIPKILDYHTETAWIVDDIGPYQDWTKTNLSLTFFAKRVNCNYYEYARIFNITRLYYTNVELLNVGDCIWNISIPHMEWDEEIRITLFNEYGHTNSPEMLLYSFLQPEDKSIVDTFLSIKTVETDHIDIRVNGDVLTIIDPSSKIEEIIIYDSLGRMVYNQPHSENINIGFFRKGMFVVCVRKNNGETEKLKFFK